jgi:hypothetical protein
MSINEFIELRENIEYIIEEIKEWVHKKSILESYKRIEECYSLLTKLNALAIGDVQSRIVLNRKYQLEYLAKQIDAILSKREAGKKEDGNIALKCNWNDKYYKIPCGVEAYNFNINQGRAWCSSPQSRCRDYGNEVDLSNHPCYESIALKHMYFGAGWDHTGERNQPRHIHSAKVGRMAILTTRPPGADEPNRIIVGCLFIKALQDDPNEETKIFGDRVKSFEVNYDEVKVNFWDYYKNAGDENLKLWASGLFRYITDETVLNMLKGIGEKYKNSNKDVAKIIDLIKYYEDLIANKGKRLTY